MKTHISQLTQVHIGAPRRTLERRGAYLRARISLPRILRSVPDTILGNIICNLCRVKIEFVLTISINMNCYLLDEFKGKLNQKSQKFVCGNTIWFEHFQYFRSKYIFLFWKEKQKLCLSTLYIFSIFFNFIWLWLYSYYHCCLWNVSSLKNEIIIVWCFNY